MAEMSMSDYHATPYRPQQQPRTPPHLPIPQQYPPQYPPQYTQLFPPRRQRKRARIVLLIACVAALATAGVFGALYIGADADHDAAIARLAERKSQLAQARDRLATTEDAQQSAESRVGDLEAEKAALTTCVDAVRHYLWDGLAGTARETALDAMFTACQ